MPNRTYERTKEFHRVFGATINDKPTIPSEANRRLRIALIAEELKELAEASGFDFTYDFKKSVDPELGEAKPNMIEIADALGDLDVVVQGSFLTYGINPEEISAEIFSSNMSKLGLDGSVKRRWPDGKILKGPNYFKPDIKTVLKKLGWIA